jgi:hypothetical protein
MKSMATQKGKTTNLFSFPRLFVVVGFGMEKNQDLESEIGDPG